MRQPGQRFSDIELNINLMSVADQVPRWIAARLHTMARELTDRGSVAAVSGTTDQTCDQLLERRDKLGFSCVLVSDEFIESFARVVERLADR